MNIVLTIVGSLLTFLVILESVIVLTKWLCTYQANGLSNARAYWSFYGGDDSWRVSSEYLGTPVRFLWFWLLLTTGLLVAWAVTGLSAFAAFAAYVSILTVKRLADRACPPLLLFLAASHPESLNCYLAINARLRPCRSVCLLNVPSSTLDWMSAASDEAFVKASIVMPDSFRTRSDAEWERTVRSLIDIVRVVVVDVTRQSPQLSKEVAHLTEHGLVDKALFVAPARSLVWASVLGMHNGLTHDVATKISAFSFDDLLRHLDITLIRPSRSGVCGRIGGALWHSQAGIGWLLGKIGVLTLFQLVIVAMHRRRSSRNTRQDKKPDV